MTTYLVIATGPTRGTGGSLDNRQIGPFVSRSRAEEAAVNLATDPRAWGRISINAEESADETEDES